MESDSLPFDTFNFPFILYVQEINGIQESLQTLYNCKAKYASSKEALESFQPEWNDRQILVPLTSSMYVPGRIKDMDNFVIDVGTGYYVEKVSAHSQINYSMLFEILYDVISVALYFLNNTRMPIVLQIEIHLKICGL